MLNDDIPLRDMEAQYTCANGALTSTSLEVKSYMRGEIRQSCCLTTAEVKTNRDRLSGALLCCMDRIGHKNLNQFNHPRTCL